MRKDNIKKMTEGNIIMSKTLGKTYFSEDGIRILNIAQAMWYILCDVPLLDLIVSEDKEKSERRLVFVFSRKNTEEAYDKWCKYEAGTGAVPNDDENDKERQIDDTKQK